MPKKYTRYDKDGATEFEVPEANETVGAPGTVGAKVSAHKTTAVGSAAELIDEFSDENGMVVHEVTIGKRKFYIRELDLLALLDVETQRLTVDRGNIVRDPGKEAKLGLSLEFSSTIMQPAGNSFEPMFTVDTVQELFSKPRAKPLIDQLADEIYRINPSLHPQKKIQMAQALSA